MEQTLLGPQLSEKERKTLGSAIHWTAGVGLSAVYALVRRRLGGHGLGRDLALGALFSATVWLLLDETATVALGLTPYPRAFPWRDSRSRPRRASRAGPRRRGRADPHAPGDGHHVVLRGGELDPLPTQGRCI